MKLACCVALGLVAVAFPANAQLITVSNASQLRNARASAMAVGALGLQSWLERMHTRQPNSPFGGFFVFVNPQNGLTIEGFEPNTAGNNDREKCAEAISAIRQENREVLLTRFLMAAGIRPTPQAENALQAMTTVMVEMGPGPIGAVTRTCQGPLGGTAITYNF